MRHIGRRAVLVLVLCRASLSGAQGPPGPELVVAPENESGVYQPGDSVTWRVHWTGAKPATEASYTIRRGGRTEIDRGTLSLVDGWADVETTPEKPGALLVEVKLKSADGKKHKACGGALVAAEMVKPSAPRPDDFDAFWETKLAELSAIPANPQLESADSGKPGVDYWKISVDNIRGIRIRGQLARPAEGGDSHNGKTLPALLIPQWAGVYPLEKPWVTDRAAEGWLVLNISAHDLPIDEPAKFYQEQLAGPLKDYWAIGNDDRDTSYFLHMYLSCYRAAEYLTARPDWDGKTLVVCGGSQGGQQTLVTAAIHPKITAALAIVPAGCDMLGPDMGRTGGWPQWYDKSQGKDAAKVHEASRYYDVVNFASRIKCPVLVGFGLIDQTCPPEGVMAAVNQIDALKELVVLPLAEHQEINGSHRAYYDRCYGAWLPALRDGKPAPFKTRQLPLSEIPTSTPGNVTSAASR